jgi:hypothetical protein
VDAGLPVTVASVLERKKRGLVAQLEKSGDVADEDVVKALGAFTVPWEWLG